MNETLDLHRQWIERLKNGDESAAENIYNSYSRAMYNTLIRITGNTELSQDLLQDAFVKAFRQIDSFRYESTFGAWLKRIVINTGLEHLRKRRLEFTELDEDSDYPMVENEDEINVNPAIIHHAIKNLPSGCRTVLTLYLLEGYTHPEIAQYLKITVSTSKTQYRRGKLLLRENLKSQLHG